jgi:DNA-binding transcriptional regulator YhcF (GntR family)
MKHFTITPENPKGIYIDLTAQEIAQREKEIIKQEQDKVIREQKIATELAKKQSAIAKLKALGLDEEEVKAIIGI